MKTKLKLIAGTSNMPLATGISEYLDLPLVEMINNHFSDGEIRIQILENVRGMDTFVIQSTGNPANKNIMELLLIIDALKRASAARITAVIPYYGYARQDRKDRPRVPISSKLIANLIVKAGASRILSVDLHADQIQGFFDIPVDHLYALPVIVEYFKKNYQNKELVIVSPDTGGTERARLFAKILNVSKIAIIDKRRPYANVSEVMNVVGEVSGRDAILVDDIVDTADTLSKVADALLKNGANSVAAACTHPVLSGNAIDKLNKSSIKELIVTNTLRVTESKKSTKLVMLSIADLLGEAIVRIHNEQSLSPLFY